MENMEVGNILEKYREKRVFITGHTGFKGSWLTYALYKAGAKVKGYSLAPETDPSLYRLIEHTIEIDSVIADINNYSFLEKEILAFQPDYIFHLAAQPLVRKSYSEPLNTFTTNIIGTANVLNALTKLAKPCSIILITTDKVYENKEWHYPYRETDRLGGYDPYSASKACSELLINSYRNSFFNIADYKTHQKGIVSVRAGNVIGGGDWSEDRLIPDIVKSIANDNEVIIRSPNSVRPWQHVLEPVFGYLQLGFLLSNDIVKYNGAWNFGPSATDNLPVITIAKQATRIWGKGIINVKTDINALHEAKLLKLDINKAINELHWRPQMDSSTAVERTINWYKAFYENTKTVLELLDSDISFYQSLLNK